MERNKKIQIRRMSEADVDEVLLIGKGEEYFCGFWPKEVLLNIPSDENIIAYISRVERDLAGFVIASYTPALRKGVVENIYVAPECRRIIHEGEVISGHLFQAVESDMIERGVQRIDCLVDGTNKACLKRSQRSGFNFESNHYKWGTKLFEDKNDN